MIWVFIGCHKPALWGGVFGVLLRQSGVRGQLGMKCLEWVHYDECQLCGTKRPFVNNYTNIQFVLRGLSSSPIQAEFVEAYYRLGV